MNTQSSVVRDSIESQAGSSPLMTATRHLQWSLRRELWESRWIYIAPTAVAGLYLFGFLISLIHLPNRLRDAAALPAIEQHLLIEEPYNFAALLIMGTTFIIAVFYCLDALYGERRDRSILFWKSLPVSDFTAVLAKASIPLVVLPLITFAVTAATQWIMMLLSSAVLLARGLSVSMLWNHLPLFQMWLGLLYHLVAVHGLWYAPIYGWLLMVSAWATRAPFLFATLPLLAISVAEKIAFNTAHFAALLENRMAGGTEGSKLQADSMSMDALAQLSPGQFLLSPGLWMGLALTALFLFVAIRLRRYRGPV